jgi:MYXO-CTERM domain-containing protein
VTDINSVKLTLRRFNDFPNTLLTSTNNYPSLVNFHESGYPGPPPPGGFANQHIASFSADGGLTKYQFQNQDAFDIRMNLNLSAGSVSPRKEAGFRFDTLIGGEGFFHVTSDGEAAAFGGPFPFFSFGNSAYTPGTTATLEMIYHPGIGTNPNPTLAATMEYKFNGVSSGPLTFGNTENGIINGTVDGMYLQVQPDRNNPNEFADATFTNFSVTVPAPGSAGLLAVAGLVGIRRRRRN